MHIELQERRENLAAIDGVLILKNLIKSGRIRENDEAEPAGTASGLVAHDNGLDNIAKLAEIVPELLLGGVPRYSSDEKLPFVGVHASVARKTTGICCYFSFANELEFHSSAPRDRESRERKRGMEGRE